MNQKIVLSRRWPATSWLLAGRGASKSAPVVASPVGDVAEATHPPQVAEGLVDLDALRSMLAEARASRAAEAEGR